jgi:hypothetical protein
MQAHSAEHQTFDTFEPFESVVGLAADGGDNPAEQPVDISAEATHFQGHYENCMEMYADAQTVADYLDVHSEWFRRCAHPMKTDALGNNGYALIIGRFGSFGYEVEPKIGLHLLPQDEGVYRIETIPIPGYESVGYHVDFRASLELREVEGATQPLTRVEWELDLDVAIHFPRFIRALPQSLIHCTGDRVLNQIVRQVSRRLTHKVQLDFHTTHNIPFPPAV